MDQNPKQKKQQAGDVKYERQRRYQQRRYQNDEQFKESMKKRVVQQRKETMEESDAYKQLVYKKQASYLRQRYKTDPEYAEKRRQQSRLAYQKRKALKQQNQANT